MTRVLFINASLRGAQSASGKLAAALQQRVTNTAGYTVKVRDVAVEPLSPLDSTMLGALFTDKDKRTTGQAALVSQADALIAELKQTDVLVLSTGMYNFSIPTQLKTYFDHVLRAGETFHYTENGPAGLLTGKRAVILAATGGVYSQGPAAQMDFCVPYLKQLLGFMGITDVAVVRAEGQALGEGAAMAGVDTALAELKQLTV